MLVIRALEDFVDEGAGGGGGGGGGGALPFELVLLVNKNYIRQANSVDVQHNI